MSSNTAKNRWYNCCTFGEWCVVLCISLLAVPERRANLNRIPWQSSHAHEWQCGSHKTRTIWQNSVVFIYTGFNIELQHAQTPTSRFRNVVYALTFPFFRKFCKWLRLRRLLLIAVLDFVDIVEYESIVGNRDLVVLLPTKLFAFRTMESVYVVTEESSDFACIRCIWLSDCTRAIGAVAEVDSLSFICLIETFFGVDVCSHRNVSKIARWDCTTLSFWSKSWIYQQTVSKTYGWRHDSCTHFGGELSSHSFFLL